MSELKILNDDAEMELLEGASRGMNRLATIALIHDARELQRQLEAERERADAAESAMRSLACYLSAGGWNSPTFDANEYEKKIRWGIDAATDFHDRRADAAQQRVTVLEDALRKVIVHTAHLPACDRGLLEGLLSSINRIARAALTPTPEQGQPISRAEALKVANRIADDAEKGRIAEAEAEAQPEPHTVQPAEQDGWPRYTTSCAWAYLRFDDADSLGVGVRHSGKVDSLTFLTWLHAESDISRGYIRRITRAEAEALVKPSDPN
jgi:hypothetical protein